MKILHIGQMIGGLDVYIRNSIVHGSGINEFVIVRGKDDNNKTVENHGVPVREYEISLYRALNPWKDIVAVIQAVRIVRYERPAAIHCHSAKGGIVGRIAGFITHTTTFYTPHAFSFLCTRSKLKRGIYLVIERLTRFDAWLLACSESERKLGIEKVHYNADKALVWQNAVPDAVNELRK